MLSSQLVFKLLLWRADRAQFAASPAVHPLHSSRCCRRLQLQFCSGRIQALALHEFCRKYNGLPPSLLPTADLQSAGIQWYHMAVMSQMSEDVASPGLQCIHHYTGQLPVTHCVSTSIARPSACELGSALTTLTLSCQHVHKQLPYDSFTFPDCHGS